MLIYVFKHNLAEYQTFPIPEVEALSLFHTVTLTDEQADNLAEWQFILENDACLCVPKAPSAYHEWAKGKWIITAANAKKLKAEQDEAALTDLKSVVLALEDEALEKIKKLELSVKHGMVTEAELALLAKWEVYWVQLGRHPLVVGVPLPVKPV